MNWWGILIPAGTVIVCAMVAGRHGGIRVMFGLLLVHIGYWLL